MFRITFTGSREIFHAFFLQCFRLAQARNVRKKPMEIISEPVYSKHSSYDVYTALIKKIALKLFLDFYDQHR